METRQGWSDGYLPAAWEEVQVFSNARPHLTDLGLVRCYCIHVLYKLIHSPADVHKCS